MRKFLKIYFRFNMILSLLLMAYCIFAFIGTLFNIPFVVNVIAEVQSFAGFGLLNLLSGSTQIMLASCVGYFTNQYFYRVYMTLYNFDRFREISGLFIIPIFSVAQLIMNFSLLGVLAVIPFAFNIASTIALTAYQKSINKALSKAGFSESEIKDPAIQEAGLKIAQLRILKAEGKITQEEFMAHIYNILENKE